MPGTLTVTFDRQRIADFAQAARQIGESMRRAAEALANLVDFRPISFPEGAAERSLACLLEHLTVEQRETFKRQRYFIVQGKRYRWRITANAYGVHRLGRSGRCRGVYCAVPQSPMPIYDVLLAQKLMLETDEDAFLSIANHERNYKFIDHPVDFIDEPV